ncbi:DUF3466 family protein [Ferrimonas futtsuensis]|uniref:DUF3466 family protein n=1 Tax=Ferrimonas futtsuensis TaxID=364764 RepID=UPI00041B2DD0|nr:DUF3466 family protein [Ferrimonas futtsuensis]
MSLKTFNYKKTTLAVALVTAWGTQAAERQWPAYEITNLSDAFSLANSQLAETRNGYAGQINEQGVVVGIAQGINNTATDDDNSNVVGEVEDVVYGTVDALTPNTSRPFQGNNFPFDLDEADAWKANHAPLDGQLAPNLDADATTDAWYFGIKSNADIRVGAVTGPQEKIDDPSPAEDDDDPFFYVRSFESRAIVQNGGNELLILPPYTTYESDKSNATPLDIGGFSAAAGINDTDQIVGYASTDISNGGKSALDTCWDREADSDIDTPLSVCVQAAKNNGSISYQRRGSVWQYDSAANSATLLRTLELPFTPSDSDNNTYTAQGLAINNDGVAVGESNQRNKDNNLMSYEWAQIWKADGTIISPTDLKKDGLRGSTAVAINNNNIVTGSVQRYIGGYVRTKFWVYDVNSGDETFTEPRDFNPNSETEFSSLARDINDAGLVVGNIEIDIQTGVLRRRNGFIYDYTADQNGDTNNFVNVNSLLTCESRGYVADEDGSTVDGEGNRWSKYTVTDDTTFAQPITYEVDFTVVEANSINENGDIVGTALVRLPRVKVEDGKVVTEEVTDPNTGETVTKVVIETDGFGKPITDQLPRPIVLRANSGVSSCTIPLDTSIDPEPNERSGASWSLAGLFALLPLAWWRRRK